LVSEANDKYKNPPQAMLQNNYISGVSFHVPVAEQHAANRGQYDSSPVAVYDMCISKT
jgi:hypothetical protein